MDMKAKQQLRDFLGEALAKHGDHADFADDESLFLSGRLDSFSMMNLVMHLEESFGIDFSEREFDVELLDTVNAIAALVAARAA